MSQPWRVPVCVFMARKGDGSHEATEWSLELEPMSGEYFCSCGSSADLVSSGGLVGCLAVRDHGCRNQAEIHKYLTGVGAACLRRINRDRTRGREKLRV